MATSPIGDEGLKRQALQARHYLERHELLNWMQDLLQSLLKDQPDDPWDFIEASVQRRKPTKLPKLQDAPPAPAVAPTTREKAQTLLPLIGDLKKLETETQERREQLAQLLARQGPRLSPQEEAERQALIRANRERLQELETDTRVLTLEQEKLERAQQQISSGGPTKGPNFPAPFGEPGPFGDYYTEHVIKSLVPEQLPRLYEQFRTQPCSSASSKPQNSRVEAAPPFLASGSFAGYYAENVGKALSPEELPRLYAQFQTQPRPKIEPEQQPSPKEATPAPSRAPPPFGNGSFGSYYKAYIATALVPQQLPRLYEQFRIEASDDTPAKKETPSSRSTEVGSARSHVAAATAASQGGPVGGALVQASLRKLPLSRPGSESTDRSSSTSEVHSRRSRPESAARRQLDSRQRKTREALQQLSAASVPISKSAPNLAAAGGPGSKSPAAPSQGRRPPQPPSQPPAPREASKPTPTRLRSDRSPGPLPQRRAEPARLDPLPSSAGRSSQASAGPSLSNELLLRDELGKLLSTSK